MKRAQDWPSPGLDEKENGLSSSSILLAERSVPSKLRSINNPEKRTKRYDSDTELDTVNATEFSTDSWSSTDSHVYAAVAEGGKHRTSPARVTRRCRPVVSCIKPRLARNQSLRLSIISSSSEPTLQTDQSTEKARQKPQSLAQFLRLREAVGEVEELIHARIGRIMERRSVLTTSRPMPRAVALPSQAKCTIAVAMSNLDPDLIVSTHGGDHSVKFSSFTSGKVIRSLSRHTRTPWAVQIHPLDPTLVASGCLSGKVCIWKDGTLFRDIDVDQEIIMSLAFKPAFDANGCHNPIDDQLFIACGCNVYSYSYMQTDSANQCNRVFSREGRVQSISFSHSLNFLLAAELKNDQVAQNYSQIAAWNESQRFKRGHIVLHDAILYSDGGMSVSSCGRFLCTIRLVRSIVLSCQSHDLVVVSISRDSLGEVLRSISLNSRLSSGLTSIKFSPTNEHIICGYGVSQRPTTTVDSNEKYCLAVFSNYQDAGEELRLITTKSSASDDVNVAIFHPHPGCGVIYGTRQGPLRLLG